jgi:hypothetical protein
MDNLNEASVLTRESSSIRKQRFRWSADIFEMFGLRFCARSNYPALIPALLSRVSKIKEGIGPRRADRVYSVLKTSHPIRDRQHASQFLLYVNRDLLARTEILDEVLDCFESDVDLYIAANSRERLFVHAGAVGWKGHTVLIPGRSGSGKTSLVAEFLRCGADYYSDDWAVIDSHGLLHPYDRKLSIRIPNSGRNRIDPAQLGAKRGEPLPISAVLITEYKQGAQWKPQATSPGRGILALLENTPSARDRPMHAMTILPRTLAATKIYESARGDKEETVVHVLRHLEGCAT